jgi:acyl carrier protein
MVDQQRAERIREILRKHGRLMTDAGSLRVDQDLYEAGLTSLASVNIMLALEEAFDVEFPDQMLTRNVFDSIGSIEAAVGSLVKA